MKRFRLLILALAVAMPSALLAQQSSADDALQILSPTAAELGKYGRIPVDYFNGLPNITVPLTELKGKGYSVPVYLTYHAGGNKPEQHPGWVGEGWALHAGGCINRIVNGIKDEMNWKEYKTTYFPSPPTGVLVPFNPGYFYRMDEVQSTDWSIGDNILGIYSSSYHHGEDYYPDEFQVCIDDIQASFYFIGENHIKIVSQSDANFTAEYRVNTIEDQEMLYPNGRLEIYSVGSQKYYAHLYHYIEEIILTNHDGTKYYFGGDHSSIEFSISSRSSSNWDLIALANTWMLSKIERPDGEVILFSYDSHADVPIVVTRSHRIENFHERTSSSIIDHTIINTIEQSALRQDLAFTLLKPAYLSSIQSLRTAQRITFLSSPSNELKYNYNYPEFIARGILMTETSQDPNSISFDHLVAHDRYRCLNVITTSYGPVFNFSYQNTSSERLRLGGVNYASSDGIDKSYSMTYNSIRLPAYNSKQTDAWGYYNGMILGQTIADTVNINYNKTLIDGLLMQAEILTKLEYPTGGYSSFEYEPHQYGKIMTQFPFELKSASGYAGGLRVSRITDVDGAHNEVREFVYVRNGVSSGIVSGPPTFRAAANFIQYEVQYSFWQGFHNLAQTSTYDTYWEVPIAHLSSTRSSHVTYSFVKEVRGDGSYSEYEYSNHDSPGCMDELPVARLENANSIFLNDAFISLELIRGQLLSRSDFNNNGVLVAKEENQYSRDFSKYIKAVACQYKASGLLMRLSYLRIYSFFPSLINKTITRYSDSGTNPNVETLSYEYNEHRRVIRTTRCVNIQTEDSRILYNSDIDVTHGIYAEMCHAHVFDKPVEEITLRNGVVVEATLTTWKRAGDSLFVPAAQYKAPLGGGVSSFTPFNGYYVNPVYGDAETTYEQYDTIGNPLLIKDRAGRPTTLYWDSRKANPTFIVNNATNGTQTRAIPSYISHRDAGHYSSVTQITKSFDTVIEGAADFGFAPDAPVENVVLTVDGDTLTTREFLSIIGGPSYFSCHLQHLPSGSHLLTFTCTIKPIPHGEIFPLNGAQIMSLPILNLPFSGTLEITYLVPGAQEATFTANDVFFEDFEDQSGGPVGFNSEYGHYGSYMVSVEYLNPYRNHILDYWQKTGPGEWEYQRMPFTGNTIIGGNGITIDQVRVFPDDSEVESYTYDNRTGLLLSKTDSRGLVTSYTYDALGRLTVVKDNDGNPVTEYRYHYVTEE